MATLLAARHSPVIIMHNRCNVDADIDIMKDIAAFFARSLEIADKAGVSRGNIVLDPGIGFGKTPEQSLTALARLDELGAFGLPLLVGASRKRFLGSLLAGPDGELRPPDGRETATAVISTLAGLHGAWGVRVHDVRASADALKVLDAWSRGPGVPAVKGPAGQRNEDIRGTTDG